MRLSTVLYESVQGLWAQAANKPFVVEMAKGVLDKRRYCYYMIQDYLYLLDYIDILERMRDRADDLALKEFIGFVVAQTNKETMQVHVPNMRALGIRQDDVDRCPKSPAIIEYIGYMRGQVKEEGTLAGLCAQLQCSWVYAFIGQRVTQKYSEQIATSPYRGWFEAYTCDDYVAANQRWIDVLDAQARAANVQDGEIKKLCEIFQTCAAYENRLWDKLYES